MLEIKVQDAEESLRDLIEDENLEIELNTRKFPITATVKRNITKTNQMSMMNEPRGYHGHIEFIFEDELIFRIQDFKISDDLMNKIKNKLKKWHYAYLELYFENNNLAEEDRL